MKFDITMDDVLWSWKLRRDLDAILFDPLLLQLQEASSLQLLMRERVQYFVDLHQERLLEMILRPEPRLPLGKWFERIFLAALRITFPFAEIRHSVPDGTGGELDFVVRDGRHVFHIECAVKFFLRQSSLGQGLNSYVGPGGRDRLDLKFHKMRDVQLRRIIPEAAASDDISRVLWMSGLILLPVDAIDSEQFYFPEPLNPKLRFGAWASHGEFARFSCYPDMLLALPRLWWMTPLEGLTSKQLEVFPKFNPDDMKDGPVMVALVRFDQGLAVERRFLVMNHESIRS